MCAGDLKPGPCVYAASNSPTEPSPPAPYEVYYVITERYSLLITEREGGEGRKRGKERERREREKKKKKAKIEGSDK